MKDTASICCLVNKIKAYFLKNLTKEKAEGEKQW